MMTHHAIVFVGTFAAGLVATFAARGLARRAGLTDKPDGRRKLQAQPVAIAGGLGVLLGAVLGLLAVANLVPEVAALLADHDRAKPGQLAALLGASFGIAALGLVDDLVALRARHKLLGQLAAVLVLVVPGEYCINSVSVFGHAVELGVLAVPLTCLWFLAAINAINLLDGMDGLLGTVGLIVFLALAGMAGVSGHPEIAVLALACAGAVAGFLVFNLPPASVYLGDCGSMLIGLVVGALAISASLKGPAVAILAPTALLVLPILDTSAAIVRRKLTGRGLAAADRGHLHHQMLRSGKSRGRVLGITMGLGAIGAAGGCVALHQQNDFLALGSALAVGSILLATGWFGLAEVRLIRQRAAAVIRSARGGAGAVEMSVRLQGTGEWEQLWQELLGAARESRVLSLKLDVNAPAWHEAFHGRWDNAESRTDLKLSGGRHWRAELPVCGHGQVVGRLVVTGDPDSGPMTDPVARLGHILRAAEGILGPLARPVVPEIPSAARAATA